MDIHFEVAIFDTVRDGVACFSPTACVGVSPTLSVGISPTRNIGVSPTNLKCRL